MKTWVMTGLVCLLPALATAQDVSVAVAANFLTTAKALAEAFEEESGHDVGVAHGATGQLYAQIQNGAPFDVFLSADAERPALLEADGKTLERRTYALGRLVLASRMPLTRETVADLLKDRTVALADPMVAPYGLAATRAMEGLRLDTATFRPVLLANVGQVATVFVTRNAEAAFVAESQVSALAPPETLDLDGLYDPIQQDAVLLTRAVDNMAARAFWSWMAGPDAQEIIRRSGYDLP